MKILSLAIAAVIAGSASAQDYSEYLNKLIKVGAKSPDFTLQRYDGKKIDLYKVAKSHKAVLVNFWFYG